MVRVVIYNFGVAKWQGEVEVWRKASLGVFGSNTKKRGLVFLFSGFHPLRHKHMDGHSDALVARLRCDDIDVACGKEISPKKEIL